MMIGTFGGTHIQAGGTNMIGGERSPREAARWIAAVEELEGHGLIKAGSYKREVFSLTHAGWEAAASLQNESN